MKQQLNKPDERIIEIIRRNIEDIQQEKYGEWKQELLIEINEKSNQNKWKHFALQHVLIWLTASLTVVNACILATSQTINVLTVLSVIIPPILTALMTIQGKKKHQETWLRHRGTYLAHMKGIIQYISSVEKCTSEQEQKEAFNAYQEKVNEITTGNAHKFDKNMAKQQVQNV